jgi:uncharacterized protein (TIGR00369 family)
MNEVDNTQRTRTITWQDPMLLAKAGAPLSGMDFLRAMVRGEVPPPPIMTLMGFTIQNLADVEPGRVVFTVEPAEYHYNPLGVAHGGLACTLCDSAMGCAVHSMLSAGVGYTTLEVKVNFVRPLTRDTGVVRCEGKVIQVGRTIATAEARLTDAQGKLYAHATTTCMIFQPRSA